MTLSKHRLCPAVIPIVLGLVAPILPLGLGVSAVRAAEPNLAGMAWLAFAAQNVPPAIATPVLSAAAGSSRIAALFSRSASVGVARLATTARPCRWAASGPPIPVLGSATAAGLP